jgi:uncharacterized protein with HEPN domain
MPPEVKAWLDDVQTALLEIQGFLPEKRDFTEFQKDIKTKRAIERNLEIIGEAVGRILKAMPDLPISNARKIVGTRNRLIHEYDAVSSEILWSIVNRHLPILQQEVEAIIQKGSD